MFVCLRGRGSYSIQLLDDSFGFDSYDINWLSPPIRVRGPIHIWQDVVIIFTFHPLHNYNISNFNILESKNNVIVRIVKPMMNKFLFNF